MKIKTDLINIGKKIRALAQTGLVYVESEYDVERYEELLKLSNQMTAIISGNEISVHRK